MAEYNWPVISASVTTGPVEFTKDGVAVAVSQDTGTPGNSVPLPVAVLNSSGVVQDPATAANQTTEITKLTSIDGKLHALGQNAMANSMPVAIASDQSAVPISAASLPLPTGAATEATLSTLNGKVTACNTGAVVLAAGTAIVGKVAIDQTTPGTTNGVQVNAALPAGTNVIGALTANQSVNVAQINGVAPLMGAGNTGTGSQRVTIASDQVAIPASQSGTWTVQPGNTANTTPWLIQGAGSSAATNANSSVASTALEASHVIKAGAGRLYQLTGVNTKASAQYIQVFNSTTVPADTAVPILLAYVPAGGNFSFDFGDIGRYFSTGIAVSNSSTAATKTIGSADCWFNAEYL